MNKAYIYKIKNKENNLNYIGITNNLNKRRWKHFNSLRKGIHYNKHLQGDYNLYGEKAFIFEEVECIFSDFKKRENYWMKEYDSVRNGYNIISGGTGICKETTIKKMSNSHKGKISPKRVIPDIEAIRIYSLFYFYGKMIRPLSKITGYSRDSLHSLYTGYENIDCLFNNFTIKTKFAIFEESMNIYKIDIKKLTYLPENVFYLIHFYFNEKVYNEEELKEIFGKQDKRVIKNIVIGKVKPDVYKKYHYGNIEKSKLLELSLLAKFIGNPVPSLERNFFEGATTKRNDLDN